MNNPVLRLENVTMQFGGVVAVDDLSMEVREGEIVALIGPNGAGKTTAFNVVTGVYAPTNGCLYLDGKPYLCEHPKGRGKREYLGSDAEKFAHQPTLRKTPDQITKMGLARTFQNIRLFGNLTVVGRADQEGEQASSLPYGQQRRLEIARALATDPRLLILDEPAAGMNPQETVELTAFIREIREKFNLSILLIEHHMYLVMDISDRIYVLEFGKLIAEGKPDAVRADPRVIEAYLGVDLDA